MAAPMTPDQRSERWLRVFDAVVAGGLLVIGVIEVYAVPQEDDGFSRGADLLGALLVAAVMAPLLVRRRHPVWAMALTGVAYFTSMFVGYEPSASTNAAQLIAVYSVGAFAPRPLADRARIVGALGIVGGFLTAFAIGRLPLSVCGLSVATWIVAAFIGEAVSVRRRYQDTLEDRARRLEAEQEEKARLASQEERARIAREFHDIWAHTLSVVVVQAGAAQEVFDTQPELARQALVDIQKASKQALGEVRRLVGSEPSDLRIARGVVPGVGDLERLAEEMRGAGVAVELTVAPAVAAVPEDIGLAVYRIVQQALTNSLTHGGPKVSAAVDVRCEAGAVVIDARDDGRGVAAAGASRADGAGEDRRQGRGLIGMRERAALFGGTVTAGPRTGGGFEVHASIPVGGDR